MIKTAYNNENTNLVFEIDRVDRVSIGNNAGIKEEYVGTLIDTSTSPDKKTENYRVQVKGFESNWTEVPSNTYTDPYVLPEATADTLGGVKIGSNVTVNDDGTISVASPFTLPIASDEVLGGIKIGSNLSIDENGILSATGGGGGGGSILDLSDEFADWNNQTDPQTYEYPDYYKHTYTNTTAQTEHIAALVTAVTAAASSGAPLLISDSQMFESVESFYADQGFVGIQATLSFKALHDDDNYYYLEFYHINAQFHSYSDSYVEFYKGAQIKGESNNQT